MRKIFLTIISTIILLLISCKKDTTGISNNLPDTTSHRFVWTADTIFAADAWQINLYDIWGTDSNNVYTVGHSDDSDYQIWHWNGTDWNNINPNILGYRPSYKEIFGFGENDFWIVGDGARVVGDSIDSKGYILRYDGAWHRWDNNDLPGVLSVWGTSSQNIYFGCYEGLIVKYDGSGFIRYETEDDIQFRCIWGFTDSSIFALGNKIVVLGNNRYNSICVLYKFYNNNFVLMDSADYYDKGFGMDLWGYDEDNFYSAMDGVYRYINNEWINEFYSTTIYSVFGSAPNNVFAGGYQSTFYHYSGNSWEKIENIPFSINNRAVWCTKDYVFVVQAFGNYGRIVKSKIIK